MRNVTRVSPGFYLLLFVVAFVTFVLHEGAHWLAGTTLGHDMVVSLNGSHATTPTSALDGMLISAAGPVVTLIQGLLALVLVRMFNSTAAYAFLFFAAFMRLMAAGVSLFNPNDEARISLYFGLGQWTLPLLMVAVLGIMTVIGSRHLRLSWQTNALAWLTASVAVSAIVGLDMLLTRG
ncbi:hypothetical protein [uncultured Brevundimonas sp.]|mgnify:CR=1 FL=1|uniref:hypothetical protein n=1 Tax=uncultured Brevundimonas sp. TaxID=213418 RepID=UPI0030ECD2E1|tara:strand:- start:1543 stop:2079 length:537 start_codon:yes stop_codon:yes gene_type:complete